MWLYSNGVSDYNVEEHHEDPMDAFHNGAAGSVRFNSLGRCPGFERLADRLAGDTEGLAVHRRGGPGQNRNRHFRHGLILGAGLQVRSP